MVGENGPQLDGFAVPPREQRRHCGILQATLHCQTCGHLIPRKPVEDPFAVVDDWPFSLMTGVGEN